MKITHAPVLRSYERDGIKIAVMREPDKNNNITYWLVRWANKIPGKRGCTSPLTSWDRAKAVFAAHAPFSPSVEQHQAGGFI